MKFCSYCWHTNGLRCRGCSGFALTHPELYGDCGDSNVPCPHDGEPIEDEATYAAEYEEKIRRLNAEALATQSIRA